MEEKNHAGAAKAPQEASDETRDEVREAPIETGPEPRGGARDQAQEAEPAGHEPDIFVSSEAGGGRADGGAATQSKDPDEDLAASYLDQLQRLKAEFDNYRRRVSREKEEWFRLAKAEVVAGLLPVLDDLRRAREHARSPKEAPDAQGLLLILKRFEDILAQLGLEEQDTRDGLEFDPEQHEAVLATPSADVAEGCIVRTLEPGYLFDGRLLRPSKVSVSSGPAPE